MSREDPQMKVRMPDALKRRIEAVASEARRSMNAEIVDRLERSFDHWPQVTLPAGVVETAMAGSANRRETYIERLNVEARKLALDVFHSSDVDVADLIIAFYNLLEGARDKDAREANQKMMALLREISPSMRPDIQEALAQMLTADDGTPDARREQAEMKNEKR